MKAKRAPWLAFAALGFSFACGANDPATDSDVNAQNAGSGANAQGGDSAFPVERSWLH